MPFADSDGVRIHYEVVGAGEPLLLIMGYGMPGSAWLLALPYLTGKFQVVYFDNRGTGTSDAPGEGYDIPQFARDTRAVMDAAGWTSAHVFGVSMGGMIAQQLALDVPGRVRSLVLGCTTCGEPAPTPDQEEALRTLGEAVLIMKDDPGRFVQMTLPLTFPPEFLAAHPEIAPLMIAAIQAAPTKRAPDLLSPDPTLARWQSCSRLHELTMPALILHGTADRLVPVAHAHRLLEALPRAELRLFKGAGHAFQVQEPDVTNRGIAEWLAAQSKARA